MNQRDFGALEGIIGDEYGNIAGLVILQNGAKLYEGYFGGYGEADAFHVFSVTKSVISALMGVAIGQGRIEGIGRRVLDFFPDYTLKRGEKTLPRVTLADMLTMTAPYKYKSTPYTKYFTSESWVRAALDLLGGRGQIGDFRYAPIVGPDVLSGILASATGKSVLEFASEALFEPLGIAAKRSLTFPSAQEQLAWYKQKSHAGEWVADPQGVNTAGWGLTLTAMEMAQIGQLYLNGGAWNGRQLVPEAWIRESTRPHSRWEEIGLDYGYLWWVIDEHSFAAMGDGGNAIYVNQKLGLVVAIASLFNPRAKDRIDFIKAHIEPLLAG